VRGRGELMSSVESFIWMQGTCSSSEHCQDNHPSLDPADFTAMPDGQ
jgi:hypothetical protein